MLLNIISRLDDVHLIGSQDFGESDSNDDFDRLAMEDLTIPDLDKLLESHCWKWVDDALGLVPHCLSILKGCHLMSERIVLAAMASSDHKKFIEVALVLTTALMILVVVKKKCQIRSENFIWTGSERCGTTGRWNAAWYVSTYQPMFSGKPCRSLASRCWQISTTYSKHLWCSLAYDTTWWNESALSGLMHFISERFQISFYWFENVKMISKFLGIS